MSKNLVKLVFVKKISINSVGKFTILLKTVAWAVVRGLFLFLEYILFFLSFDGLFLYRHIRRRQEYSNCISSCVLDEYVTNSTSYIQIGTRISVYTGVQLPILLPFWDFMACSRENFTFTFTNNVYFSIKK